MTTQEDKQDGILADASVACYEFVYQKTGIDPVVCAALIDSMLYGTSVIATCKENGLVLSMVLDIRNAFDEFVETQ